MPRELRVHSVPTRAENVRTFVEIVAIVAAGIWALYTFVYEQRIKPLGEAPSFSVPTTVEQSPAVGGVVFVTVHKGVQNTGNVPIDLAAEALSVYGERLTERSSPRRIDADSRREVIADVERQPVALLYSIVKLRSGAVGGNASDFFIPPHSSNEETYLVAIPAHRYPVILVARRDYFFKPPQTAKIPVRVVKTPLGGYDLESPIRQLEYDAQYEFPIRP